jgi:hypothetical protein
MLPERVTLDYSIQTAPNSPSVEEQIKALIYREFFTASSYLLGLLEWLKEQSLDRLCGRIIGNRRSGKTLATQYCVEQISGQKGALRPVPLRAYYVDCLTSCSSRMLCNWILKDLGRGAKGGKPEDLRLRTWDALELFKVEILLIDNAHHLTEKALGDVIEMYSRYRIPVILIGPTSLDKKLEDFDVFDYFKPFYQFGNLSEIEFTGVIKTFEREFLNLPEPIELIDAEAVSDLFSASTGNFADLVEILIKVIRRSSDENALYFDKGVLSQVLDKYGKPYSKELA